MAFIGIIADNKHELQIKRILESRLNSPNKAYTIVVINDKSISNVKNIRFETILAMDLDVVENEKDSLNEIIKNAKYLVLNADLENNIEEIQNVDLNIITFGFNSKATITASSVENNFIICLQRKVISLEQQVIEPQELEVKLDKINAQVNNHNIMGIASILLIYGKTEIFF